MGQRLALAHLMPYTGLQYGVLRLRTFAEQLSCSLKLLGFVPMHSDSQQFVRVASWFETFTAGTWKTMVVTHGWIVRQGPSTSCH
jgi:hypothetical protein